MEVLREIFHRKDVATDSAWGVVAPLGFIQHQLPTVRAVDEGTIRRYIENRKWDDPGENLKITAPTEP